MNKPDNLVERVWLPLSQPIDRTASLLEETYGEFVSIDIPKQVEPHQLYATKSVNPNYHYALFFGYSTRLLVLKAVGYTRELYAFTGQTQASMPNPWHIPATSPIHTHLNQPN